MGMGQKCLVVVRIRGTVNVRRDVEDTLRMLNLVRNCHATLVDDRPSYLGMLRRAQSILTWGEASKETIALLLKRRGRTVGNKRLTDDYVKKLGFDSLDALAEALYDLKVRLKDLPGVKPVFRLHPPRKGYKGSIKKSYHAGGEAGYRGEAINDLIRRML
ncbi:MAG: 50S ribosomal protein L30 [Candidatus Bathyarchaeota archaeon B63]|nr:MAG: 50S ribosomal protein L30 [Candidatus Bathyarchaeota archaeon B63]